MQKTYELMFLIVVITIVIFIGIYLLRYLSYLREKADALREDPIFCKEKDVFLDEYIEDMQKQFERKRLVVKGLYQVPREIIKELKKDKFEQETLQKLVNSIVEHTGVCSRAKVIVTDSVSEDVSGAYEVHDKTSWELQVYKDERHNIPQIIAILIHESAHNFLYYHNMELYPEEVNEILTDIVAVFLGFGPLLLEGYKPIKEIAGSYFDYEETELVINRWKIGYLNTHELAYVIRKYEEYMQGDLR